MNACIKKIRSLAKKIIAYTMEGEEKVYRLRHTPFRVKIHFTRHFHRELEQLPIQYNKVVFDNYMGKGYGCNGKYVTESLLAADSDLDIVWTVQEPQKQRAKFPKQVRLVRYGSEEAMREYATAGIWCGNYQMVHYLNKGLLKKKEQVYIQMWHGSFGIKKIENDCKNLTSDTNWTILAKRNAAYTDYWISNSSFETEIYRRAFWNADPILEYGHPRNDIFFGGRGKEARRSVEQYLGRSNYKLLLYVPTFRDDFQEWEEKLNYGLLKQSLEQRFSGEWLILVRQHPRMKGSAVSIQSEEEYCADVTGYSDIQELLAAADAVVTDYSSAVFDYILTGRPAFIYAPDYRAYRQMRGLYYSLEETPFPIAENNRQMAEQIAGVDEVQYREKARKFLEEKGSAEDGEASRRVASLILKCTGKNRK